jgi:hypothetical protein
MMSKKGLKIATVAMLIPIAALWMLLSCTAYNDEAKPRLEKTLAAYVAFLSKRTTEETSSAISSMAFGFYLPYIRYLLFDMTGDGIPELCFQEGTSLQIFSYDDNAMFLWADAAYSTVLRDGAILWNFPANAVNGNAYRYYDIGLRWEGDFELEFSEYDSNLNGEFDETDVFDINVEDVDFNYEKDFYVFDGICVKRSDWVALTERFLSIGEADGWRMYDDFDGHLQWDDTEY